jgi:hypothetical protein
MKTTNAILLCLMIPCVACAFTANDAAKTITSDGSHTDTQAALDYIDGKNQEGWVLTVGTAGASYTWTAAVGMASTSNHGLTITSAGGAANKTIITADRGVVGGQALALRPSDNKLTRVTGFTFRTAPGTALGSGVIAVDPNLTSTATMRNAFRIDHCRFENFQNIGITVLSPNTTGGAVYGLVDNCDFVISSGANGLYIYSGSNGNNWNGSMTWGTADTVVIEDCTFTKTGLTEEGRPAVDSSYFGARWMLRRSTLTNWVLVAHGADTAPTSTMQVEVLHNNISLTANDSVDFIMYLRGGSMRFWDNAVSLTNGATLNQIVKTAIDPCCGNPATFQQIGHGAVNGVETLVPVHVWGNNTPGGVTLVGAPNNNANLWNLGTEYYVTDPALIGNAYTELAYPHPLRAVAPTAPSNLTATPN